MTQSTSPLACQRLQERAFWVQGIYKALSYCDKSPEQLPDHLQSLCSADNLTATKVSQAQMNQLWQAAMELTGDPHFGLHMGQMTCGNTLKVLILAASSSATAGDAIERIIHFFPIFSTQAQLYTTEDEQYLTLYLQPKGNPHAMHIEALISQCEKIWRAITPEKLPLVMETRLPQDSDRNRPLYEQALGCKVRTGSKRIAVRFNHQALREPLSSADDFLLRRLDTSLEDMLSELPNVDFAEQVKQRIRQLIGEREVNEELVAAPFNMSPRHLRRKLSAVQTTYERLLDEVRMEIAIRLIREARLSLGRIAYELGFLDPSSFTRAFRRWTGMSPTAFKDNALKDRAAS
ncbi:helix-turn-helix domain-containing protein [Halopseudomonas salegens]|uniref:AraC-type DNA-binding protein n=1 Tax=Halopseudomonas salegens TaxID=1434072 RepID=A0A1H2FTM6_9GAMM|nr:AraC family transcriptional regulator [Halopseudomonas salegens]SDU10308.1 AraC-type DNA-binding protein [Halopseudomonas salegens]